MRKDEILYQEEYLWEVIQPVNWKTDIPVVIQRSHVGYLICDPASISKLHVISTAFEGNKRQVLHRILIQCSGYQQKVYNWRIFCMGKAEMLRMSEEIQNARTNNTLILIDKNICSEVVDV